MATQSSDPSNPSDVKSQTSEVTQTGIQQDVKSEATNLISPKSVFVNSEPIREEQVQNAIKFLSHPRVRGSPVIHRRSFLEKKGLTKEEIDEAFRRVPDPPSGSQETGFDQDRQKTSPNVQPQTQTLQPVIAAPAAVTSSPGILTNRKFHWYHAVIAVGVLATSGVGAAVLVKKSVIPRLKSWVRRVVLEEEEEEKEDGSSEKTNVKTSIAEEAAAAAKAAAAAATDVARASKEMMNARTEEKRYFEEFMNLLGSQVQEMKSISSSIQKLEGQTNKPRRSYSAGQEDFGASFASTGGPYTNGKADYDSRSGRSSPPVSVEASTPLHPKSYMEIMEMVRGGEKPSNNIKEMNDLPNPRVESRTKPWDSTSDSGVNYQLNSESSAPWWQRKNPRSTEKEDESGGQIQTNERPLIQPRTWVPPQPPSVAMQEAAEAIRRPKPTPRSHQEGDDQMVSNSASLTDELQKITKISESGGEVGIDANESNFHNSEIQEQE